MKMTARKNALFEILVVAAIFGSILAAPVSGAEQSPGPLVDTDWVAKKMETIQNPDQTQIRLVDVGDSYVKGHISGAVNIKWPSEAFSPDRNYMVMELAEIERVIKKLGITDNTHIVLYDGMEKPPHVARVYWSLKYWNFENVSIMDGGIAKWRAEGRSLTTEVSDLKPREFEVAYPPDSSIRAGLSQEVMPAMVSGKPVLVDNRDASLYKGKQYIPERWIRAGTIPGAVNLSAMASLNEDKTYKSAEELKTMHENIGVTADKEIILFCDTGTLSSQSWFVLSELLGYEKVQVYDGSMREYANRFDLPMMNSSVAPNFPLKEGQPAGE